MIHYLLIAILIHYCQNCTSPLYYLISFIATSILNEFSKKAKRKMQTRQNAALRAVENIDHQYSTDKLHAELKVQSIQSMMVKDTCKPVFKGQHGLGPPIVNDSFVQHNKPNNLRSAGSLNVRHNVALTQFGGRNIMIRAGTYQSELSDELKNCNTFASFKCQIKKTNLG